MKLKNILNSLLRCIFKVLIIDTIAIIMAIIFCILIKNLNMKYFSRVISYVGIFLCGLGFISYLGQMKHQRRIAGYGLREQVKQFREEKSGSKDLLFFWESLIAGIIIILLASWLGAF